MASLQLYPLSSNRLHTTGSAANVWQDNETQFYQFFCCLQCFNRIGQQIFRIRMNF